jgi:hypothetical protein
VAQADANGRLELQIHPAGLELGIALHIVGIALVAAALLMRKPARRDAAQTPLLSVET